MNRTHEKTQECVSELHYKTAYLHLFGAIAGLTERIEAAGIGMSLADVRGALEQALRDAEERACAD
ncbi:hypothetical protein [Candidatus Agathobaculum pullicola]|uniref:hypothetical protein n=1 Tax=Candidatus Agathobaculum pullicola TaxID=2838426 RepID=UPI003F916BDC